MGGASGASQVPTGESCGSDGDTGNAKFFIGEFGVSPAITALIGAYLFWRRTGEDAGGRRFPGARRGLLA